MGTPYLCSSEEHKYGGGNNANIWFQYRHKFDQLFTANEQIIPLNTFSNTFTIQRALYHALKLFFNICDGLSVAILMSRGVNVGN